MSDETSDLEARVSALEEKVASIQSQLGKAQAVGVTDDTDDDDGGISFPVGGTGP